MWLVQASYVGDPRDLPAQGVRIAATGNGSLDQTSAATGQGEIVRLGSSGRAGDRAGQVAKQVKGEGRAAVLGSH